MKSEHAGKTVTLKRIPSLHFTPIGQNDDDVTIYIDLRGVQYEVQGYWINLEKQSWQDLKFGNWACAQYYNRVKASNLPTDDKVLYGKINNSGYLVHDSEVEG